MRLRTLRRISVNCVSCAAICKFCVLQIQATRAAHSSCRRLVHACVQSTRIRSACAATDHVDRTDIRCYVLYQARKCKVKIYCANPYKSLQNTSHVVSSGCDPMIGMSHCLKPVQLFHLTHFKPEICINIIVNNPNTCQNDFP